MLAKLSHPNIVTIHDFGQAGGWFYLLMEFVDGVNLRQAMKVDRFTSDQALAVVPSVCEALHYAHNEGILHRDIKPENILLDSKGRVKIADFGIAKLVGESVAETGLTGSGATLGTPHYMAPEQLEQPQNVDQRADVYSLGVVFYEMLTGELPIGRFAPPSEKSAVDPRMDEVVLRTLEKERERRTQTAGEVKTQVESIGTSGPATQKTQAIRIEPLPRSTGMATQSKIAIPVIILVGILILGIAIGMFVPRVLSSISQLRQPTKTIELTSIKNGSAWSSSPFPAGEAVVAVVKHPDGTLEDAMTQTITQRGHAGSHTTTVFSWQVPASFSSALQAASVQAQQNYEGRPLVLRAGKPFQLFTLTNTAGHDDRQPQPSSTGVGAVLPGDKSFRHDTGKLLVHSAARARLTGWRHRIWRPGG
jgi:serine/threonine protein kinase